MNKTRVRDETIQLIYSNLIMAGLLSHGELNHEILTLQGLNDILLGLRLIESRHLLDMSLEIKAQRNKN